MDKQTLLQQLQDQLEKQLEELHDSSDHPFTASESDSSVCEVCGWMGHDGSKLECGHTAREHAEDLLADLKAGKVELGEPDMIIEVTIAVPRRKKWWEFLN